ncbi:hypothetical protein [Nitrobacter winogradskyi]|uniref:Uncharacterized protein n=1 Tax=Nitrobacter winogradskyi TaxID=913 RepID=A0ACC6AG61_NITWI|nr:hypothetical protein [Nitrobacter winogradskyi]MCP1998207.1 hypothetical protein [Nitrobacter winogradskyi]
MKKIILATSLMLGAALLSTPSMAVPAAPGAIPSPTAIQPVQFFYGGRNYCWYNMGWRGPGFYWCGFASRRGMGWGGGAGWRGWDHRGGRHFGGPPHRHGPGMHHGPGTHRGPGPHNSPGMHRGDRGPIPPGRVPGRHGGGHGGRY